VYWSPGKSVPALAFAQTPRYEAQRFVPQSTAGQGAFSRFWATWCPYSCATIASADKPAVASAGATILLTIGE